MTSLSQRCPSPVSSEAMTNNTMFSWWRALQSLNTSMEWNRWWFILPHNMKGRCNSLSRSWTKVLSLCWVLERHIWVMYHNSLKHMSQEEKWLTQYIVCLIHHALCSFKMLSCVYRCLIHGRTTALSVVDSLSVKVKSVWYVLALDSAFHHDDAN